MKYFLSLFCLLFISTSISAQFQPSEKGLIIKVSDGTDRGRDSKVTTPKGNIPTSYDGTGQRKGKPAAKPSPFTDPIRELGMADCIQAAAFLERPEFGKAGFFLIFSVNDSIGGKQGTHTVDGVTHKGVFRLIRQKSSLSEAVPKGMTSYRIQGTFFILGIS